MAVILTIEDSVETQLILKRTLENFHQVHICYNLADALKCIKNHKIDLIILDLMLPDGEGLDLFQKINAEAKAPHIPTIILSSLSDLQTRILGLNSGADDYMIKPFQQTELLARIDSVLRRGPVRQSESIITLNDIVIDLNKQAAFQNSNNTLINLNLTPIEFKILLRLSRKFGAEVSREQIQEAVWNKTYISKRNVDSHICKMRKKIDGTQLDVLNKRDRGYYLVMTENRPVEIQKNNELPAFGKNNHTTQLSLF